MSDTRGPEDQTGYTLFGRIGILALCFSFTFFGSMHFSLQDEAVRQLPEWVPWRHPIVILSGIWEVSTGILILVPELRKRAAISSLALLTLMVPIVYFILSDDKAFNPAAHPLWIAFFRVVLIPHNLFLAICALYLYRHPESMLAKPAPPGGRAASRSTRTPATASYDPVPLAIPALLLAANCAGCWAVFWGSGGVQPIAFLWALGCCAVGALIGFLFGVPRLNPQARFRGRLLPNANVEAVSDWLTKILVGVGLVNFQAIGAFVDRLAAGIATDMMRPKAFAMGIIVYFFAIGVIQGYVLTRIFLSRQFDRHDEDEEAVPARR